MATLPTIESLSDPKVLGDMREKFGMSRTRAPRAEAANANAPAAPPAPAASSVAGPAVAAPVQAAQPEPTAQVAPTRGPDGKFLKKESETAAAAPAPTPAPAQEVKRAERIKIGERELLPQEIEAVLLRDAQRPAQEEAMRQHQAKLQQYEQAILQKQREIEAREQAAAAREAEAQAYQEFLMDAEKRVASGEVATIADFIKSQQPKNALPHEKALTPAELDAWYERKRAQENAAIAEKERQARALQAGNDFNAAVLAAAKASPVLMKRRIPDGMGGETSVYAENIAFRVADHYFKQGINIATLPPRALNDRIQEFVKQAEADEIKYAEQLAGEYLSQRVGQTVIAPTPAANTGVPVPQAPEEFRFDKESKLKRFREVGGDLEKWFESMNRDKQKLREEAARLRGQG